jgi:hypothetical protein
MKRKVTDKEVVEIRRLADSGVEGVAIAKQFGISQALTSDIITNKAHHDPDYIMKDMRKWMVVCNWFATHGHNESLAGLEQRLREIK